MTTSEYPRPLCLGLIEAGLLSVSHHIHRSIRGLYASASLKQRKEQIDNCNAGHVSEAFMPRPH